MSKVLFLVITALLTCFSAAFAQKSELSSDYSKVIESSNRQSAKSKNLTSQQKIDQLVSDTEIESQPVRNQQPATDDLRRFEIGAHYTNYTSEISGVGGRFTVNLNHFVAVEAEVTYFPNQENASENTLGLFGVKAGKRWEKFGIFGKVRPGFNRRSFGVFRYERQANANPAEPFVEVYSADTIFALDIGAVAEYYPTKRIVTRLDLGNTMLFLPERTVNIPTFQNPAVLAPVRFDKRVSGSLQLNIGIGFRF